jgi:hypothetical protein
VVGVGRWWRANFKLRRKLCDDGMSASNPEKKKISEFTVEVLVPM